MWRTNATASRGSTGTTRGSSTGAPASADDVDDAPERLPRALDRLRSSAARRRSPGAQQLVDRLDWVPMTRYLCNVAAAEVAPQPSGGARRHDGRLGACSRRRSRMPRLCARAPSPSPAGPRAGVQHRARTASPWPSCLGEREHAARDRDDERRWVRGAAERRAMQDNGADDAVRDLVDDLPVVGSITTSHDGGAR